MRRLAPLKSYAMSNLRQSASDRNWARAPSKSLKGRNLIWLTTRMWWLTSTPWVASCTLGLGHYEGSFGTAASDTTFKVLPYRARDFFYVPLRQVLLDLLSHLLRWWGSGRFHWIFYTAGKPWVPSGIPDDAISPRYSLSGSPAACATARRSRNSTAEVLSSGLLSNPTNCSTQSLRISSGKSPKGCSSNFPHNTWAISRSSLQTREVDRPLPTWNFCGAPPGRDSTHLLCVGFSCCRTHAEKT